MFECQICGLLSLGGTACPACGSQLRTDLSLDGASDEILPTEVPGLDDAAAAWYDLEGIEPPAEEAEEEASPTPALSSLPFGFQGESTVYDSRLPFGIGSFADGIPFDASQSEASTAVSPAVTEKAPVVVKAAPDEPVVAPPAPDVPVPSAPEAPAPELPPMTDVHEPLGEVEQPPVLEDATINPPAAPAEPPAPAAPASARASSRPRSAAN